MDHRGTVVFLINPSSGVLGLSFCRKKINEERLEEASDAILKVRQTQL
jgi:hypothetical protein